MLQEEYEQGEEIERGNAKWSVLISQQDVLVDGRGRGGGGVQTLPSRQVTPLGYTGSGIADI